MTIIFITILPFHMNYNSIIIYIFIILVQFIVLLSFGIQLVSKTTPFPDAFATV